MKSENRKSGQVFSLTADDFILTKQQRTAVVVVPEADTDSQPLALAVIVETGGLGASHLHDYRDLGAVLDAVIGDVPHRVAVVGFDSVPHLEQDFTTDTDVATKAIATLHEGDRGAAILDALSFGINILRKQPPDYRRAVLLFSETADGGSHTTLEGAVRAVDDTNTAIYSFGFSSTKAALVREASKLPGPRRKSLLGQTILYGWLHESRPRCRSGRSGQARRSGTGLRKRSTPTTAIGTDGVLIFASDGLKRNVPESVAQLTDGGIPAFKEHNKPSADI